MERIFVAVRARPVSPEDASSSPWRISGNSIFLSNQSTKFDFDRVFSEECKTAEVYEARTKKIVESAVSGFNGTVFAYGQTSSGKTHTMRGTPNEAGVIPLAVYDLFHTIEKNINREFLVRMSYMEIYNEEINDLLVPEHRKLQVHESLERGIFVAGLREEIVTTPDQVLDLMEFGESHRQIGETNMNLYSSRSHTIFRMIIESREKTEDGDGTDSCDAVRVSFLNLVDLAGSERAAKTGAEGVRLKEGSHINKSLMTLGTVIKKLSEGAEGQGGHVPYRDSKLTRILQPALGGNANTSIICNITLAQIHADETKSSLQFASRATRVKNCACVNEVLTDAALLKRQKKEIEELREKLLGSHSEHFEKEILNLRNTLLQSELEKERIVLELEEEKKAKAQREKRLQEQAQKIANLSSMVLYSKREEDAFPNQKKRRQTWCPVPLSRGSVIENLTKDPMTMTKVDRGQSEEPLPIPFHELPEKSEFGKEETNRDSQAPADLEDNELSSDFSVPDACAFLHVTDRRKARLKNRRLARIMEENSGRKSVDENELPANSSVCQLNENNNFGCQSLTARESEAIHVIKQLEDKIKELETEKTSVQKNLDSVVELVTQQNIDFTNKYDELHKELLGAREDAKIVNEELISLKSLNASKEVKDIIYPELSIEIEGVGAEFHHSRDVVDNLFLTVEDLCQSFSKLSNMFLEVKEFASKDVEQLLSILQTHEKVHTSMKLRAKELESEKILLLNESINYSKKVEELKSELHFFEESMQTQRSMYDLEKDDLYHQIVELKKEISRLSASTLAKEKELLRKDLEKTETKLKDTQFKLKNALQDKIKLESEKAQIEREAKNLQNQRALLERDINKRDSVIERRHDPKVSDNSKAKGHAGILEHVQSLEYQKLEIRASEMELEIASLKQDLLTVSKEKQDAISNHEILSLELDDMSTKLSELKDTSAKMDAAKSELEFLKNEMDAVTRRLEESESSSKKLKYSIDMMSREKEQLTEQLTNSLLELEMEKAALSGLEKTLSKANERIKILDNQIDTLSNGFSEQLSNSLLELEMEKATRSSLEKDLLEARQRIQMSDNKISTLSDDLSKLTKTKDDVEELTGKIAAMETKMHVDALTHIKEKTKLKMQLQGAQTKLDAYRERYKDILDKMELMKKNYTEAIEKYHQQLASYAVEILRLKGRSVTPEELALTSSATESTL